METAASDEGSFPSDGANSQALEGQEEVRYLLPVYDLEISDEWNVGPVRFSPAGTASKLVESVREERGWRHDWYDDHLDTHEAAELDATTVAIVSAVGAKEAYEAAADALGVLRLFQSQESPMVDTALQTFGLKGQVEDWRTMYLKLDSGPSGGWFHGGAFPGWTFSEENRQAFRADPGFQFLASCIGRENGSTSELRGRALLGTRLLNSAILEYDVDRRLLSLAFALEVLLGEEDWSDKKYGLARRVAYLSCSTRQNSMCGRDRPSCPYLAIDPGRRAPAHLAALVNRSRVDARVTCTRYLNMVKLYEARNRAVHGGSSGWSSDDVSSAVWTTNHWLLKALLDWLAAHADDNDFAALEDEIRTVVAARPPEPLPPM